MSSGNVTSQKSTDTGNLYIKIYYRKNLKMSPAKLAAQAVHAAMLLLGQDSRKVVVLEMSDQKFNEAKEHTNYVVVDAGLTEVPPGTETALAFWDTDE